MANHSKNNIELFPKMLARTGGMSYNSFSGLSLQSSADALGDIQKLEEKVNERKEELSELLASWIAKQEDRSVQNQLQNFRRNLYNDRKIKNSRLKKCLELLPEEIKDRLESYFDLRSELDEAILKGEELFNKEVSSLRSSFQDLIKDKALQNGLILSSRTLFDRIESYGRKKPEEFRKKEFQNEMSFSQYLSRITAKTSPFSTFTNLSQVNLETLPEGTSYKENGDLKVESHVRLNNYILKYFQTLLISYQESCIHLKTRINPTVSKSGEFYRFLTNNDNIESFQELPSIPIIDELIDIVKSSGTIRIQDLIDRILEQVDAEGEEVFDYIRQLLDYGLLEFDFGVSGTDPDWDLTWLSELDYLVRKKVPHIQDLINVMKEVRQISKKYERSPVTERIQLCREAFDRIKSICFTIHEAADLPEEERMSREEFRKFHKEQQEKNKKEEVTPAETPSPEEQSFSHRLNTYFNFTPEKIFYEDTTRSLDFKIDQKKAQKLITKLDNLLKELAVFRGHQVEKTRMALFFQERYGPDSQIRLLDFYESYYREVKKPEEERIKKLRSQKNNGDEDSEKASKKVEPEESSHPMLVNIREEIRKDEESLKNWKEILRKSLELEEKPEEVRIKLADLERVNSKTRPEKQKSRHSYGAFLQFFQNSSNGNNDIKACVTSTFSGYGKMMSRFLHIVEPEFASRIKSRNQSLADDRSIILENCDASYFNANIHPTLMPYEIWAPGSNNNLPPERQLPVTDFVIRYNGESGELNLIHEPSGKKTYVNDLGFQSLNGRSQLFQLLEKFTHAEYLSVYPLIEEVNKKYDSQEKDSEDSDSQQVKILPRIVYEDDLILQRKTWVVPKSEMPEKNSQLSDWDYFRKIESWRQKNGIPREVFVTITNRWNPTSPEKSKKLTRDDYKPQFIDFRSFFCIGLFAKLVDKAPAQLRVVEMSPLPDQMFRIGGKPYVTEFVAEWQS